ncbi:MAG: GHKL domain-containing protein [Eubacterium sp.]|nr:GHKL domain-containing protein [Eubacterium sp.]
MKKHMRIKNYILISMVIMVTLSLGIAIFVSAAFYTNKRISIVKESMEQSISDIARVAEKDGLDPNGSSKGLPNRAESMAKFQNGNILIIKRNYKVFSDSDGNKTGSYIIDKDVMDVMLGQEDKIEYEDADKILMISPIKSGESIIGVTIFNVSLSKVNEEVAAVRGVMMLVLAVLLIIDVIVIVIISRRSVEDLNNVNEKIMHTALGTLHEKLPEDEGFIEIQVLAENYNDVMSKLAIIDQTRSEFVSNVSHELKTPITSMKVLAESLVQNEAATAEEYKEFMTDIVEEIDRETKIINDLLTLVRTDSNKNELNLEKTDINEMMETIIKTVTPLANNRGIDMSYECYREVEADVDSVKLSLAISNLIENAVKYNVENGWIKCSLNTDHKFFYIKVADSGVGIPDDAKDKVFDRFYRVDKARSRDTGGTGLGLSITRSIINAHKGTIKLYSESGKGTTFTVKIPLEKSL